MVKEQYAIFALPPGRVAEQLRSEVGHLAGRYGTPPFEPHTTVLAGIERPREEVLALAAELAKQVKKYRINFVDVTRGSSFYQCVYLSIAKDEGTMAAAATARQVFDMTTTGPYMPHLSLLYSDMPAEERAKVVEYETARLYGASAETRLVETAGCQVDSLAVWYVPEEDTSLASWCQLEEFELTG